MARIANVSIADNKQVEVALTAIYGIGVSTSRQILAATKIDPQTRVKDLSESELSAIREEIDKHYTIEGDLAARRRLDVNRLKEIGSYRGDRHKKNLPVRGQRTRTNARTKRGKRITVGSGRKPAPSPT